jgi:hypothetical protein
MRRDELPELHHIAPITNVRSIMRHGILSHNRADRMEPGHESVSMQEIQDRRRRKAVPGGRRLHDYANLYICARNPMMYSRKHLHASLCVLRVSTDVLDEPGAVIADRNASRAFARFYRSPAGLGSIVAEVVFDNWWQAENPIVEYRQAGMKCAEVLVPNRVDTRHIVGAYVSGPASVQLLVDEAPELRLTINPYLFFLTDRRGDLE